MAAVTLVQPANPPVARTNTSRANDASASSSFGSYLDKEQASNDASKAADNAAETTSTASAEAADGNQKAERKDEQDDGGKVDDTQANTTDPRGLLQWLQSQLPPTAPAPFPPGTAPAQAVLTDGQTGAPLATTAGAISGVLAKLAVKPGDTPPTQALPPASAGAGGAAAGGSDAAPFQLPDPANAGEGRGAGLRVIGRAAERNRCRCQRRAELSSAAKPCRFTTNNTSNAAADDVGGAAHVGFGRIAATLR